jgi:hypothetical protein
VLRIRDTARASEGSTVQGKGGMATWLRCLAGSYAAGEESMRSAAAGWVMGAVCLGVHWRGCGRWRAVEAPVSNGHALVGTGEREREW